MEFQEHKDQILSQELQALVDLHYNSKLSAIREKFELSVRQARERYFKKLEEINKHNSDEVFDLNIAHSQFRQDIAKAQKEFYESRKGALKNLDTAVESAIAKFKIEGMVANMPDEKVRALMQRMKNTYIPKTDDEILAELDQREKGYFDKNGSISNPES